MTCTLASATTLVVESFSNAGYTVSWFVVEFASGAAVSAAWQLVTLSDAFVQTGLLSMTRTSGAQAVVAVEPSRSFLVVHSTGATTTLVRYYLVQLAPGALVQSGSSSTTGPAHTQMVVTAALSPPVALSRAVPFFSADVVETAAPASAADQDSGSFYPLFPSTGQITFTRASGQDRPATIDWFVVQFP